MRQKRDCPGLQRPSKIICAFSGVVMIPSPVTSAQYFPFNHPDQKEEGAMPKPHIMFDHDGRHPLIYMYEPPIHKEEFEAAVDKLAGTPVEALMLTLGDARSLLYDTRAGELWGQNIKMWPHLIWRRAHQNFKKLIKEGNDPLRIICDRAHAKGMLLYTTLLVQQGGRERMLQSWEKEGFDDDDWRLDVQPLEIGASGEVDPSFPGYRCLDFKHEEVRDKTLAVIEEVLTDYPIDGFELQLNYQPYYFHPNEVEAGRPVMTEWIRRVYTAVKESGSERELAIHVPASIEGALSVGLDAREWMREGIVDVLIAEGLGDVDATVDFRPLVEAAEGSACRIHAAISNRLNSDRLSFAPIEMLRAAACNYWEQGVDGLYMAHWFASWPYGSDFYEKLRELPHPDIMGAKDKSYYIPTETNSPPRLEMHPGITMQLPANLEVEAPIQLDFTVSDDLLRWGRVGRVHEVLLRVRIAACTELDRLRFKLNGKELSSSRLRKINQMYRMSAPRYRVSGQWFIFRLDRDSWTLKGSNSLEVTLLARDPDVTPQIYVRDVELEIKYLMGKHFHRGFVDADLGPSEHAVS